jgi:hypothetical protein
MPEVTTADSKQQHPGQRHRDLQKRHEERHRRAPPDRAARLQPFGQALRPAPPAEHEQKPQEQGHDARRVVGQRIPAHRVRDAVRDLALDRDATSRSAPPPRPSSPG